MQRRKGFSALVKAAITLFIKDQNGDQNTEESETIDPAVEIAWRLSSLVLALSKNYHFSDTRDLTILQICMKLQRYLARKYKNQVNKRVLERIDIDAFGQSDIFEKCSLCQEEIDFDDDQSACCSNGHEFGMKDTILIPSARLIINSPVFNDTSGHTETWNLMLLSNLQPSVLESRIFV